MSLRIQLRWDKADKGSYYYYTGRRLQGLLNSVDDTLDAYLNGGIFTESIHESVESVYCSAVYLCYLLVLICMSLSIVKGFSSSGGTRN